MQGMRFLLIGDDGKPINHGVIVQQIGPEKYLCQFARVPTVCRLVHTDEIMGWNLFPNDDAMNDFILAITKQASPEQSPGDSRLDIGPATQSPAEKKAKKKTSPRKKKKKTNGKN